MSSLVTKFLLLFLVLYASICVTYSISDSVSNLDLNKFTFEEQVFHLFQVWKKETKREYKTLEEETSRFQIFKSNLKYIREKNDQRKSASDYSLGLNKFSDMSYEEFSKIYLHETKDPGMIKSNKGNIVLNGVPCPNAPSSWDWRTKGAVTYVKDQVSCGGCWAFSATGAIEGINQIVKQWLPSVSEQQLISCNINNNGCSGGWYGYAFQYVINNGGIDSEGDYPYTADNSACNSTLEQNKYATIDGYNYWYQTPISETSLRCFVFKQPVSVSVYASNQFKSYKSGIFTGEDCSGITSCQHNHAY